MACHYLCLYQTSGQGPRPHWCLLPSRSWAERVESRTPCYQQSGLPVLTVTYYQLALISPITPDPGFKHDFALPTSKECHIVPFVLATGYSWDVRQLHKAGSGYVTCMYGTSSLPSPCVSCVEVSFDHPRDEQSIPFICIHA